MLERTSGVSISRHAHHGALRVATWNCFGAISEWRGVLRHLPRWPDRFRHPSIAAALAAFDIVCVQENFIPYVTDSLHEIASIAGMHLWHDRLVPHSTVRSPFGAGLALLSRRAPAAIVFDAFETPATGMDAYAAKGMLTALFDVPGHGRVRVINVHLQSDDPIASPVVCRSVRAAQMHRVRAQVDPSIPTLICGDLNIESDSDEYRSTLQPWITAGGMHDHGTAESLLTYDNRANDLLRIADPAARPTKLDYVIASPGSGRTFRTLTPAALVLERPLGVSLGRTGLRAFASDHFGLGVTLQLVDPRRVPAAAGAPRAPEVARESVEALG